MLFLLMKNGLNRLIRYYSFINQIPWEEIEKTYQELDEEKIWYNRIENQWQNSQISKKERGRIFIDSNSVSEEKSEQLHKKYLEQRYEEEIRRFYESGTEEISKNLKKIALEYKYRYESNFKITEEHIEQARTTSLSKFVKTKNNFTLCPFHKEKVPSFHVTKNLFICFGCQKSGDTISFIMETKNLKFIEAVRYITDS